MSHRLFLRLSLQKHDALKASKGRKIKDHVLRKRDDDLGTVYSNIFSHSISRIMMVICVSIYICVVMLCHYRSHRHKTSPNVQTAYSYDFSFVFSYTLYAIKHPNCDSEIIFVLQ